MGLGALRILLEYEQLLLRQRWQCQVPQRVSPTQGPTSTGAGPCISRQLMLLQGQAAAIKISLGIEQAWDLWESSLSFLQQQLSDSCSCLGGGSMGVQSTDALWLPTYPELWCPSSKFHSQHEEPCPAVEALLMSASCLPGHVGLLPL